MLGHAEEMVVPSAGEAGVGGNVDAAVRAVLEANGHRQPGGELTVQLWGGGGGGGGEMNKTTQWRRIGVKWICQ